MTKRDDRICEGRHARLRAEVRLALKGERIVYRCIYLVFHQANQYKLGWDSVSKVDINTAIGRAKGVISRNPPYTYQQRGKSCQF